jgi:hypothetical protein
MSVYSETLTDLIFTNMYSSTNYIPLYRSTDLIFVIPNCLHSIFSENTELMYACVCVITQHYTVSFTAGKTVFLFSFGVQQINTRLTDFVIFLHTLQC